MRFKKLTEHEVKQWDDLFAPGFEESPLKEEVSEEVFNSLQFFCSLALAQEFEHMNIVLCSDHELGVASEINPVVREIVERALEHAIACGDAQACCNLGNRYHDTSGNGSAEDYATAIEIYELGKSRGDSQSAINLGYMHYYGRGTERDYARAYECFAFGAIMDGNPEGFWKLGDLYASGKGVSKSDFTAWSLYKKAYEHAGDSPIAARAAHHMADYLVRGIEGSLQRDPHRALKLYNEAECGYYRLIDDGLTYYRRQLEQAIDGQDIARCMIRGIR